MPRPQPFARAPFALAACLIAATAQAQDAQDAPFALTYEAFETAVPHVDLAVCPTDLAAPGRFCRLTAQSDMLNVFVFSEEGDQPLVALQSWPADLLAGLMD